MSRYLPAPLVGGLAFVAFVLNTLFWSPLLIVTAVVRVLVPFPPLVRACRRTAEAIATIWVGTNVLGLKIAGRMTWDLAEPSDLRRDAWYLVTSNHRSWVDIVILQWLFNRRIPMLKFFLKKELIWVPVLGLCWWALEFPFMRRYPRAVLERRPELRRKDLERTRAACERFRDLPVSVLNFVEGTRFSAAKRAGQASPYANLLLPRAGGVAQVVTTLGDRLAAWLDVTIVYPAKTPTFWDLISGQIPSVTVRVEALPIDPRWAGRSYEDDPGFREEFQAFLRGVWASKDTLIDGLVGRIAGRDARPGPAPVVPS